MVLPGCDGDTGSVGYPLTATFSEDVVLMPTGSVTVSNVTDATATTYPLPNENVTTSGSTLTVATPPWDRREASKNYAVLISSDAIEDLGGNAFAGIADSTTWDFNTLDTINYEWSGAVSGDWNDPANWSANGVPIDFYPYSDGSYNRSDPFQLYAASGERIVFNAPLSANPVPTANIISLGGNAADRGGATPQLDVVAGALAIDTPGYDNRGLTQPVGMTWTTTVGDGDRNNGSASLTCSGRFRDALNRDESGAMVWTVEADGDLTIDDSDNATLILAYGTDRPVIFVLNGGSFTTPDALDMLRGSTDYGPSYVEFNGAASTFTASFGEDFVDLDAVMARCGEGLTFRSTVGDLTATDNDDGTFTVAVERVADGTLILIR